MVLAVACGGSTEEPFLLLDPTTPDAMATATSTATATATSTGSSQPLDSGARDTGPACSTVDELLVSYGLASTCGPCIDSACTSEVAQCNSSCTCPAAIVGFVQCVSLGASTSTCASVATSETEPSLVLGFYMCASSCTSQCHMVQDAGNDGGDAAASDAAGPGDGGEPDADAGGAG